MQVGAGLVHIQGHRVEGVVVQAEAGTKLQAAVVVRVAVERRLAQLQQQQQWTAAAARPLSHSTNEGASMCRPVMVL